MFQIYLYQIYAISNINRVLILLRHYNVTQLRARQRSIAWYEFVNEIKHTAHFLAAAHEIVGEINNATRIALMFTGRNEKFTKMLTLGQLPVRTPSHNLTNKILYVASSAVNSRLGFLQIVEYHFEMILFNSGRVSSTISNAAAKSVPCIWPFTSGFISCDGAIEFSPSCGISF